MMAECGIAVAIPVRDEAANLARCLPALAFADEVLVVDDGSRDGTADVARAHGARVVEHAMESFAAQRNWAMDEGGIKAPWVLHLDADEVITPALAKEMRQRTAGAPRNLAGYYLARKTMLGNRWLRYSATFPAWVPRLARCGRVRYEPDGHGERVAWADGRFDYLREPCLHHNFSKGWDDWFARHNRYSAAEARKIVTSLPPVSWRRLAGRDDAERRRALRSLSYRLPLRPLLRFLYVYLVRAGCLDGGPGWTYSVLQAIYEYMIALKVRELRGSRSRI